MMIESFNTGSPLLDFLVTWGLRIGLALVIFFVGRMVVNWIVRVTERYLRTRALDELIIRFATNILAWTLLFLVIIAALSQLGIDTTAFIALLGAAGLAVGLALQDSMKNFASGVLLIIFRPFTTGHFIEAAGTSGSVESITLFTSTLRTPDNRSVIVPNGEIYSNTITNYSALPTRRVDMTFGIGYDDDLRKAKELLHQIIAAEPRILADPAPLIAVSELGESSVNFAVRPWVQTADYWDVFFAITEQVKLAFDDHGISIPYPQMDVHVQTGATAASQPAAA
ncbi:MAG: mechanosensitive ion channel [Caldilinea sp.]|nr:mechanosensitive ion channel [Caldilinea sp.]MCW5845538.1 mechanosensitive ion channel [Caldilinea sp.]